MELRVLRYFLIVAREQNITRAAEILHITQPTLSRQLMQLEDELDTTLFIRGKSKITLTESGILLRRRAEDILDLADKTENEFHNKNDVIAGDIMIGAGETKAMHVLAKLLEKFNQSYPQVNYHLFSGNADEVKEKIDRGLIDIALLTEPVDIEKYDFIRLKEKETWGVLMRKDNPLASLSSLSPKDLIGVPIIITRRLVVQNEIAHWFGDYYNKLNIIATYNLIYNAAIMVEEGLGCVISFNHLVDVTNSKDLCFIPFSPKLETGTVLVWRKHQIFSQATTKLIEQIQAAINKKQE